MVAAGRRIAFSAYRSVFDYWVWNWSDTTYADIFGESHPCDQPEVDPDDCYTQGLFVMESDGSELRLLQEGAIAPSWSPDGKQIAYAGRHGESEVALFTINADGTDRRIVVIISDLEMFHSIDYLFRRLETLSWSPDGEHIMYDCYYGSICVLSMRTGDAWSLPHRGTAAWSPDGSRIAVRGRDLVSTMDPRGSDVRYLAKLYPRHSTSNPYSSFLIGLGPSGDGSCFNGVVVPDFTEDFALERIDLPSCDGS